MSNERQAANLRKTRDNLLHDKRLSFILQKAAYWNVKSRLLLTRYKSSEYEYEHIVKLYSHNVHWNDGRQGRQSAAHMIVDIG